MRVLAIDTSTELGSVAVCADGALLAEETASVHGRHAETVVPMLTSVLHRSGIARRDVDLVAVGVGPGSFTGTRIGVATAKGLAIALERPMVGIVSLHAIAYAAPGAWIAPAVDAHKGEVYFALYERADDWIEHLAPAHAPPGEAIARLASFGHAKIGCGSGYRAYDLTAAGATLLPPVWDPPRAAIVATLGEARFIAHGPDDRARLEPVYLRASDAKLPGHIAS